MALTSQQQQNIRVLVVDDEQPMLNLVEGVLKSIGVVNIVTALDGQQALGIVSSESTAFDLVISDWQMPNMDGLALLEEFRELHPGTPFVMLTAKNDVAAFGAAKRSGATYFFMKPMEAPDLAARLSSLFLLMD